MPAITVVVCTRNRPIDLARCLDSLKEVGYPDWSVIVIDQSDSGESRVTAEQRSAGLPRLVYHHMQQIGLTRARNEAMRLAEGEILAFLDDDCTVSPSWLHDIARAFEQHPDIPLIYGQVVPISHDPNQCFIPGHEIEKPRILRTRLSFVFAGSLMGASMYLRREICRCVGPYDVHAGPGAEYNIEDRDYAYRHLRAGYAVLLTPAISVTHYGARYYSDPATGRLLRNYPFAFGAQDMKFLRCGDAAIPGIILGHLVRMLLFIVWPRLLSGHVRRSKTTWICMYIWGLICGSRPPVLRRYGLWGTAEEYHVDLLPSVAGVVPERR